MNIMPLKDINFEKLVPLTVVPCLKYHHLSSGKVRELYDLGDYFLMIATDRLSAFNYVLPQGIPGKGIILTQISAFWFNHTRNIIQNHLPLDHEELIAYYLKDYPELMPRAMIIQKCTPFPIEVIVRGYLDGSAWKTYRSTGKLFELPMNRGLCRYSELPNPVLTPTAKSLNDEHITSKMAAEILPSGLYSEIENVSIELYEFARKYLGESGLILADTKFEFGCNISGDLVLIDEALTPDSSRFWMKDDYVKGAPIPFDKQLIRNYLESTEWDKKSPPGNIPQSIIRRTLKQYLKVLALLR